MLEHNSVLLSFPYYLSAMIFIFGVIMMIYPKSYFRKLMGMCIMQVGVLVFFIVLGKVSGAAPPVSQNLKGIYYSSPLPHVLVLTAIVVGVAILSMAVALLIKIYKNYGTLEEDEL